MNNEFRSQHRKFVDDIRQNLDELGNADIMLRPSWLIERDKGDPFSLEVPVGPDLVVSLRPRHIEGKEAASEIWVREAETFSSALVTLKAGENTLVSYADEMRDAAVDEVRKAQADGLDIRLAGIGFKPAYAHTLDRTDREDALNYIIAEVKLEVTSYDLKREIVSLTLDEPEDVVSAIQEHANVQRERQCREDELHDCGADLEISDIGIDILRLAGRRPEQILADLHRRGSEDIVLEGGIRIGVMQDSGLVEVSLETEEIYWNGKVLQIRKKSEIDHAEDLPARPLSELITDRVFAGRPVSHITNHGEGDTVYYFDETRFYFDASAMRIWDKNEERRKAA